jgi:tetratricopeptide (TPR) repeat protein
VAGDSKGGRGVAAWAVAIASPLIAYLIVKAAAASLSTATALLVAPLPPADPAPSLKSLGRLAQLPTLKVSKTTLRQAEDGLAGLPLAFEPFYIAARAAEQAGDRNRAIALMEEARHRRPSYPALRMQLMVYYTQAGRFREAMSEVDFVLRRNDELRPALIPEMTKLMADPRGREALALILAGNPPWSPDFYSAAAARKVTAAEARDLYRRVKALKPGDDLTAERQLILEAQAGSGDYAAARNTWLASLPSGQRSGNERLFDGDFRGIRAPGPFSWQFNDQDVGRAEPSKDGQRTYLDVAYFGGRALTLAEQVLALAPGRYTLRAVARSGNGISSGRLYWRLSCLPAKNQIALLDLTPAVAANRRFSTAFTVPASGCPGQSLTFQAEPGDIASGVGLEVSDMEIIP